jgi:hypothetical protein
VLGRELGDAAADEELRHLAVVEVRTDGERVLRADAVEDGEDVVLLDELAREQHRLRDVELVVLVLEDDLAAEDASLRIHILEVGVGAAPDRRVGGRRAAQRDGAPESDLRRRHSGRCERERCRGDRRDQREMALGSAGTERLTEPTLSRAVSGTGFR